MNVKQYTIYYECDGTVVRASTARSVDMEDLFLLSSHNKRLLKMLFTTSPVGAQSKMDRMEKKLLRSLVVSLGKALNRMPPFFCGRQVAGPSSQSIVVVQSH